jgi:ribosomal protein L16/L10AE
MSKRTPQWALYGDYGFREATRSKSPARIRREIAEAARRNIDRSMKAGLGVVRSNWPWLRNLQPAAAGGSGEGRS